jgi:hypothetical protein
MRVPILEWGGDDEDLEKFKVEYLTCGIGQDKDYLGSLGVGLLALGKLGRGLIYDPVNEVFTVLGPHETASQAVQRSRRNNLSGQVPDTHIAPGLRLKDDDDRR